MSIPTTLIIHCEPSHTTRLTSYFSTEFSSELSDFEVLDTKQGLIKCSIKLTDITSICEFVNDELYHNATANRYLHRYFLCNETTASNFHDITAALNESNQQDDSTWVIRIQSFPKIEYKIGNYLMEHCYKKPSFHSFELNPKAFTHILSVVQYNGKYYFGVVTKDMFYVKADDKFNIESPCRAHYKIKEVFDRCNHLNFEIPENGKAIDLGAAPGGWTKYLSERLPKGQVIAIDPAELTIEITPNIVHLKIRAEDAVEYLSKNGPYDCIVCDIATLNHETLVQMFAHIIPFLKSGSPLIWTIKLRKRSEESKRLAVHIEDAVALFKKEFSNMFDPIEIIWLLSNKAERTVVAIKK